jgi:hypothetical protein
MEMVLGRAAKLAIVLVADLITYLAVLSLSLRLGPDGLGPRLCQLSLAFLLPAAITYRALWKKGRRRVFLKLLAGLLAGGLLVPSFLASVPLVSLACSVALLAAPYYLPKQLPKLKGRCSRRPTGPGAQEMEILGTTSSWSSSMCTTSAGGDPISRP